MVKYKEEAIDEVIEDIKPLIEKHYMEIARHQDKIALNPDYDKYVELYNKGALHIVTARVEGRLVGYTIHFLAPHLHYRDHLMAMNDILYVLPEYRGGIVAARLFKFAEVSMKQKGVTKIHIHMKTEHDFSRLLKGLGYVEIEKIYERMLT